MVGKPACVEVRIDGHIVAIALGRGEQRLELDLFDRFFLGGAAPGLADGLEDFGVGEERELLGDPGLPLQQGEIVRPLDDLQVVPEFPDGGLCRGSPLREREHAHHLWEVGV